MNKFTDALKGLFYLALGVLSAVALFFLMSWVFTFVAGLFVLFFLYWVCGGTLTITADGVSQKYKWFTPVGQKYIKK